CKRNWKKLRGCCRAGLIFTASSPRHDEGRAGTDFRVSPRSMASLLRGPDHSAISFELPDPLLLIEGQVVPHPKERTDTQDKQRHQASDPGKEVLARGRFCDVIALDLSEF